MKTVTNIAGTLMLAIALAACSDSGDVPEADNVTETQMDDVEVIDGTISDEMVDVDAEENGDVMAEGEDGGDESGDDGSEADTEDSEE